MACSSASLSDKRKRKVLTIDEKLEIVSLLNNNHSLAAIASKYGIIRRDRQKLLDFKKQTLDMGMYVFILTFSYPNDFSYPNSF